MPGRSPEYLAVADIIPQPDGVSLNVPASFAERNPGHVTGNHNKRPARIKGARQVTPELPRVAAP
jgi:hypothetical protein